MRRVECQLNLQAPPYQLCTNPASNSGFEPFKMFAQPRIRKVAPPPPKKRKATHAVEEITFDKDARAEYLTGFRKRKQARIKHAKEIAEEKAREERIEMRKQVRASSWIWYNAPVDK